MFIIRIILYILLVWGIATLVPDITLDVLLYTGVIVGAIFFVINSAIKPVLKIITVPLNVLTLGLFTIVLNAVIFWFVGVYVPGFSVGSYLAALIGSVILGLGAWLIGRAT
ncbi:MAG: putative membrane protein [Planctomycetota bacterium]|jgi:putative membrane protein